LRHVARFIRRLPLDVDQSTPILVAVDLALLNGMPMRAIQLVEVAFVLRGRKSR
jgi:hypothetical protein